MENASGPEQDADSDIRREELSTLEAIYGDSISIDFSNFSGLAKIALKIENGISVSLEPDGKLLRSATVENLPPLELSFSLPAQYPYEGPLTFELSALVGERSKLNALRGVLARQWEDMRDQVLFSMIDILQEAAHNSLELLGKEINCGSDAALYEAILDFDREQKQREFDLSSFTCDICQRDLKGVECLQFLPCSHIFCNACLRDFFSSLILGGDVEKVHCPDFECSKQFLLVREKYLRLENVTSATFNFEEFKMQLMTPPIKLSLLQMILSNDVLYKKFLELFTDHQHALIAKMFPNRLVSCPRSGCPAMIFRDNMTSRLVICRECGYAFCNNCRKSFHSGTIDCTKESNNKQYCSIPVEALESWLNLEKGSKGREQLRYRYGNDLMNKVSDEYKMDVMFNEMLADESQGLRKCPTCDLIIQRMDGCNKMKCSSCYTFFCNICGVYLEPDHPYDHFNDKASLCYAKLFEGMAGTEELQEDLNP